MRAMLVVAHLMGSGHLVRAAALTRGLAAAGIETRLLSGGRRPAHVDLDGIDLLQLPPLAADGLNYRRLLDVDGRPADAKLFAARRAMILAALREFRPEALITELFPFGRRMLAGEFEALLQAAAALDAPPLVFASIRDAPEPPRKPGRAADAAARLARWYRGVLVHGDPALLPLEASWPVDAALRPLLAYTGYVAEPLPEADPDGPGAVEVLVAVGGGVAGRTLLDCAAAAAATDARHWRLLVGGSDGAEVAAGLAARFAGNPRLIAEPARPDYRAMLRRAACSVSLAGYNTTLDLAQSGTPAILVPMAEGGEREQTIRARAFARLPQFEVLEAPTPQRLAAAVDEAVLRPRAPSPLRLDGARRTAEIVAEAVRRRIGAALNGRHAPQE